MLDLVHLVSEHVLEVPLGWKGRSIGALRFVCDGHPRIAPHAYLEGVACPGFSQPLALSENPVPKVCWITVYQWEMLLWFNVSGFQKQRWPFDSSPRQCRISACGRKGDTENIDGGK